MSTNLGLNPLCITEKIFELQLRGGTIISPTPFFILKAAKLNKTQIVPDTGNAK